MGDEQETVWVRGTGGVAIEMSLPLHETVDEQIAKGQAGIVDSPDGATVPIGVPQPRDSRPALNDRKAEWVSWAVHQGADADEAEALSKDDLIAKYGQPAE